MKLRDAMEIASKLSEATPQEQAEILAVANQMRAGRISEPGRTLQAKAVASNGAERKKRKRRTKAEMAEARRIEAEAKLGAARREVVEAQRAIEEQAKLPDPGPDEKRTDIPAPTPVMDLGGNLCLHTEIQKSASWKPGRSLLCEECDRLIAVPFPPPVVMSEK